MLKGTIGVIMVPMSGQAVSVGRGLNRPVSEVLALGCLSWLRDGSVVSSLTLELDGLRLVSLRDDRTPVMTMNISRGP